MTLVVIGLAWTAGLVAVGAWDAPWWMAGAWFAAAFPAVAAVGRLRGHWRLLGVCLLAALIAGWRMSGATDEEPPDWTRLLDSEVTVSGVVDSEPDRNTITTGYVLRVERIRAGEATFAGGGKVLVQLHQYDDFLPGDRLTLEGELEAPAELDGFDYRAYLERQSIFGTMFRPRVSHVDPGEASPRRWLTDFRLSLDRSLQRALPEPESSLAAGIAFGRDDGLSREAKENYNASGLRHLVAVSGSNVSLVAAFSYMLAIPLIGRRWAWLPAGLLILCYLGAAGLVPSVLRSGLMAMVLLAGYVVGRPQSGLPALAGAAMLMTLLQPEIALQAGFQLSALATAGLITLAPWLQGWLARTTVRSRIPVPNLVLQATTLTTAATLATVPVMWVTFERVSLISPVANVVVAPAFAAAFAASVLTAFVGLASADAGATMGAVAWYPLAFIGEAAEFFAGVPLASVPAPSAGLGVGLLASGILGVAELAAYLRPPGPVDAPRAFRARQVQAWRLALAGVVGAACLSAVPLSLQPAAGPGELVVQFLDVGQGDAILVTSPHGKQVLVDGGPSGIALARELGEVMPHWDRTIDAVVLTHPQEDHMAGFPALFERFKVGQTYASGATNRTQTFAAYEERVQRSSTLRRGDAFELDGVRFEVLWPPVGYEDDSLNNVSLILRVEFEGVSLLLTGDAEGPALMALTELEEVRADILKVPHHGSKTTPAEFFDAVGADLAVISVGGSNIFGHPHPDTLAALAGTLTIRTDTAGTITVRVNDGRFRVATER